MKYLKTMNEELLKKLNDAVDFIKKEIQDMQISCGIILGSGLGNIAESLDKKVLIPYHEVPHMPTSTTLGHRGNFIIGIFQNKPIMVMDGRIHYYEGYSMQNITFPIMIMQMLKIKTLIITAAVGSLKSKFKPSDIVLIKDHINFMGDNPLRGVNLKEPTERFVDLTFTYDKELRNLVKKIAKENKIKVYEGVYVATCGPSYETPAEIRAFKKLGGDLVGMSLVPEAIVAKQANMRVLGIAYVANFAAGLSLRPLSHLEVLETATKVAYKLNILIREIIKRI